MKICRRWCAPCIIQADARSLRKSFAITSTKYKACVGERKTGGAARGRNRKEESYTGAVFFKLYRKLPAARCARDTTRTRQPLPAVMACYATSSPPTTTADSHSIPSDIRILVLGNEGGRACVSRVCFVYLPIYRSFFFFFAI